MTGRSRAETAFAGVRGLSQPDDIRTVAECAGEETTMNGAIFFSGKYGSTAQYAKWIGEATGLSVFDVRESLADPSDYEFLVLGSSVMIYRLSISNWLHARLSGIENKPVLLFTVSGAPAGKKLAGWVANSLPASLHSRIKHVALGGRQIPAELTRWHRLLLKVGARFSSDPEVRKQELEGFDFMDKSDIEPIVTWVRQRQSEGAGSS